MKMCYSILHFSINLITVKTSNTLKDSSKFLLYGSHLKLSFNIEMVGTLYFFKIEVRRISFDLN